MSAPVDVESAIARAGVECSAIVHETELLLHAQHAALSATRRNRRHRPGRHQTRAQGGRAPPRSCSRIPNRAGPASSRVWVLALAAMAAGFMRTSMPPISASSSVIATPSQVLMPVLADEPSRPPVRRARAACCRRMTSQSANRANSGSASLARRAAGAAGRCRWAHPRCRGCHCGVPDNVSPAPGP